MDTLPTKYDIVSWWIVEHDEGDVKVYSTSVDW